MPVTRVLIVDDEPAFRLQLHRLLAQAGLQVIGEAGDIPRAKQLVAALQPDLAVVDLMLPGINGVDGIVQMKALCPSLRAILISAHRNQANLLGAAAQQAGAEAFIPKDELDLCVVETWSRP